MAEVAGFEPATYALTVRHSTAELYLNILVEVARLERTYHQL